MHARSIVVLLTIVIGAYVAAPGKAASSFRLPSQGTVSFQFAQSPDPDNNVFDSYSESVSYHFSGQSTGHDRPLTQVTYSYHHDSDGNLAPGTGDCDAHVVQDAQNRTASTHTTWAPDPRDSSHTILMYIASVQVPIDTSTTYTGSDCVDQNRSGTGYLSLPVVRFKLTQAQLRNSLATGSVSPTVPLNEDGLDLGSTPLGYQIQTTQQKTVAPHPRPGGCKRDRITVYFAVNTTFHPENISRKYGVGHCWLWARPTKVKRPAGCSKDDPRPACLARCEQARGERSLWAFNEVTSAPYLAAHDQESIKDCYRAIPRGQRKHAGGALYFAYDQNQNHWETTGHVPKKIGTVYGLLELYGGLDKQTGVSHKVDVVTRTSAGDALATWEGSYRNRFGAVVNFGGIGNDAYVASIVKEVCQQTRGKVMGLYAGSGEKSRLTGHRLKAVWQAMKDCTTN